MKKPKGRIMPSTTAQGSTTTDAISEPVDNGDDKIDSLKSRIEYEESMWASANDYPDDTYQFHKALEDHRHRIDKMHAELKVLEALPNPTTSGDDKCKRCNGTNLMPIAINAETGETIKNAICNHKWLDGSSAISAPKVAPSNLRERLESIVLKAIETAHQTSPNAFGDTVAVAEVNYARWKLKIADKATDSLLNLFEETKK